MAGLNTTKLEINAIDHTIFESSSGDAFYGFQLGCIGGSYDICDPDNTDFVMVDTDANGTYDTALNLGPKNVNYLTVKDIEFTGYNGGHSSTSSGARAREGMIALEGVGNTNGIVVDHIYVHDNDYSLQAGSENFWSMFSDSHNAGCSLRTEVTNSLLIQNNEKMLDDDCGVNNECGCPKYFHDNIAVAKVTSSRSSGRSNVVFFYLKSIDTFKNGTKKAPRIFNNDFVIDDDGQGEFKFMDLQAFGNSMGTGLGELWVYGNIFRNLSTNKMKRFWFGSCDTGSSSGKLFFFNNTMDATFVSNTDGVYKACTSTLEAVVEKNNAYWSESTDINTHDTPATTHTISEELCSASDSPCTTPSLTTHAQWFWATATTYLDGRSALAPVITLPPVVTSPLYNAGLCDPDNDGTAGVDYNGDGLNDEQWYDINGNVVSCFASTDNINVGAVQVGHM